MLTGSVFSTNSTNTMKLLCSLSAFSLVMSTSTGSAFVPVRTLPSTAAMRPPARKISKPASHLGGRSFPRTTISMSTDDDEVGGSSIPIPTLTQILSLWLTVVAGNRLVETIPQLTGSGDSMALAANLGFNVILCAGGLFTLAKSVQGTDYSTLEDLDTNSWAKQAGAFALENEVPTEYTTDEGAAYQLATFAGGCFWGTELKYQREVGVVATAVGYTQGNIVKPSYEQVCSGSTGHTEGIQLLYDPTKCSYERLVTILLGSVDPTLLNGVGNDRGTQYRHGIYTHTEEQRAIAEEMLQSQQSQYQQPIVTELKPATIFYPAENYHQRYLEKGGQSAAKNNEEKIRCYG